MSQCHNAIMSQCHNVIMHAIITIYQQILIWIEYYQLEMYAVLGSIFAGSLGFFIGYNQSQFIQQPKEQTDTRNQPKPNHSFLPSTIQAYTELRKDDNKYTIYSKYHQCQLSTHQIIKGSVANPTSNVASVQQAKNPLPFKAAFQGQYRNYAYQLINNNKCNSVQLIHGPIFSKDSWSKNEQNKHIYFSKVAIDKEGAWIADRYYAIVICNRRQGSYFNAFQHRKPSINNIDKFQFLNNLTSMKKLQEQTGLVFNLNGGQLTLQDYQGLSKQRKFGSSQSKETKSPPQSPSN